MNKIGMMIEQLNSFGSPSAIAEFLTENGIKGDLQDGDSCVISNWFLTETDAVGCSTTEEKIIIEGEYWHYWEMVPNPITVEFIRNFDDYQYPELVIDYPKYYEDDEENN